MFRKGRKSRSRGAYSAFGWELRDEGMREVLSTTSTARRVNCTAWRAANALLIKYQFVINEHPLKGGGALPAPSAR